MKKKFAAFILCVLCLLSAVGCGQAKTDEQTPPTDQSAVTDDYLTTISGTYVELFPELSKSEYRNIWIDATTPLVGAENAETTTDMLLGMCMAEPYGPEAAEKYAADPDRRFSPTPTSCWTRKTKTALSSIRARMKIPASLPISPSRPTPWKPPIIWSFAMQRI